MAKRKERSGEGTEAMRSALAGLRDALDLTLTRVLEDDMSPDEAREVLGYLEKELATLERHDGIRPPASSPRRPPPSRAKRRPRASTSRGRRRRDVQ